MKALIVCIMFCFIFPHGLISMTYYVSPAGNDSNPGTYVLPWQNISKAASTLIAGDTVLIRDGIYQEQVLPVNSGSPGSFIVYAAFPGENPVVNGDTVTVSIWGGLWELYQIDYIAIYGITVINSKAAGIIAEECNHLLLRKNLTHNTVSSGIAVWTGSHIVVDSNIVELACNDGEQECITLSNVDSFEICYNHVLDGGPGSQGGEGIDVKEGCSNGSIHHNIVHDLNRLGIYVDAWDQHTFNIEVYNNLVYHCAAYGFVLASEAGGLLENIKIYNNIAYDNKYIGFSISGHGQPVPQHPIHNVVLINNTAFKNGWASAGWGGGINIEESADVENIVIRNNICSQNLSFQIADEVGVGSQLIVDHNLIDGFRNYPGEMYGNDSVVGYPQFIDTINYDLHIEVGSPAIDNGSSVYAPGFDYDENPRPSGNGYDIGCL
ncbi:MAG: right-handed parallel beta-helix repeat-containing protein [bacterium]